MSWETESENKKAFGKNLAKFANPFEAALKVFPGNSSYALRVANEWLNDPEVLKAKNELIEIEGEEICLPTKAELCKLLWNKMNDDFVEAADVAKLSKVYAEVRGFTGSGKKEDDGANITNNVMIVREFENENAWEKSLLEQQRKLIKS